MAFHSLSASRFLGFAPSASPEIGECFVAIKSKGDTPKTSREAKPSLTPKNPSATSSQIDKKICALGGWRAEPEGL